MMNIIIKPGTPDNLIHFLPAIWDASYSVCNGFPEIVTILPWEKRKNVFEFRSVHSYCSGYYDRRAFQTVYNTGITSLFGIRNISFKSISINTCAQ